MSNKFFRDHHVKFLLSAPIIFLIIINTTSAVKEGNFFSLQATSNYFLTIGEETSIEIKLHANSPINAVGGMLTFTPDTLEVISISRVNSIIDLWTEEPSYSNQDGVVQFSGGMVGEKASIATSGDVFTAQLRAQKVGVGSVTMRNTQLLANNGEGTNIAGGNNTLTFYVRNFGTASPDINNDNQLTIADVNLLYLKTFRLYDPHFDLNGDKKINWTDVKFLIALF